jgi:hypothetical protein
VTYNSADAITPEHLGRIAAAAYDNLVRARRHLATYATGFPPDDISKAEGFYAALRAQNAEHITLLKGWLRLKRLSRPQQREAREVIDTLKQVDKVLDEIRRHMPCSPAPQSPLALLSLVNPSDIPNVTAALTSRLEETTDDLAMLRDAAATSMPILHEHESTKTAIYGARLEYENGERSLTELLNAEQEYIQAGVALSRARRDLVVTGYRLRAAQGDLILP